MVPCKMPRLCLRRLPRQTTRRWMSWRWCGVSGAKCTSDTSATTMPLQCCSEVCLYTSSTLNLTYLTLPLPYLTIPYHTIPYHDMLGVRSSSLSMARQRDRSTDKNNDGGESAEGNHGKGAVQNRLYRSARLWSMYVDLEESLGSMETAKAAYEVSYLTRPHLTSPHLTSPHLITSHDSRCWTRR